MERKVVCTHPENVSEADLQIAAIKINKILQQAAIRIAKEKENQKNK